MSKILEYNINTEVNVGRAQGVTSTPRPYAGGSSSHTIALATPSFIIAPLCSFYKGRFRACVCYMRCGILISCTVLFISAVKPKGDGLGCVHLLRAYR